MALRHLTLALVSLGLLGSPLSALVCAGDNAAAMACCQNDPQNCNRGGKSDDCCRTLPDDGSESATLVTVAHVHPPTHVAAVMPTTVCVPAFRLSADRRLQAAGNHVPLDLPPPPLSPLRI